MHVATVSLRSKLSIPSTLDVFGISSTPNSSGRVSNTTASLRHGSQGGSYRTTALLNILTVVV